MTVIESASPAMRLILDQNRGAGETQTVLDPGLAEYLADGIAIGEGGTIVSCRMATGDVSPRASMSDATTYEALVNKIYVPEWLSDEVADKALPFQVDQGVMLADLVANEASKLGVDVTVVINCQIDSCEAIFRFHRRRDDEPSWLGKVIDMPDPVLSLEYNRG